MLNLTRPHDSQGGRFFEKVGGLRPNVLKGQSVCTREHLHSTSEKHQRGSSEVRGQPLQPCRHWPLRNSWSAQTALLKMASFGVTIDLWL